jgi:hypothetical protein
MDASCEEVVVMEDVRIIFKNFSGKEGMNNAEGDRNFSVLLDDAAAVNLERCGYRVKYLTPREEGDPPQAYLKVSVKYRGRGGREVRPPRIIMLTSNGRTPLREEDVELLDWADIRKVDLIIRPYEWTVSGNSGVKAYLQTMFVTINEDALELKYAQREDPESN